MQPQQQISMNLSAVTPASGVRARGVSDGLPVERLLWPVGALKRFVRPAASLL